MHLEGVMPLKHRPRAALSLSLGWLVCAPLVLIPNRVQSSVQALVPWQWGNDGSAECRADGCSVAGDRAGVNQRIKMMDSRKADAPSGLSRGIAAERAVFYRPNWINLASVIYSVNGTSVTGSIALESAIHHVEGEADVEQEAATVVGLSRHAGGGIVANRAARESQFSVAAGDTRPCHRLISTHDAAGQCQRPVSGLNPASRSVVGHGVVADRAVANSNSLSK